MYFIYRTTIKAILNVIASSKTRKSNPVLFCNLSNRYTDGYVQMNKIAASVLDAIGRDEEHKTHIAYGTIVKELKEVSRSYKEARMALDVGKIFFDNRDVIAYSSLGIGRLIYQLPIPL